MIDRDALTRVLAAGRGREDDYPRADSMFALFARQAVAAPTRTAVAANGSRLTYAEVRLRAIDLAERLVAAGTTPGARVAVCLPRGSDQIVAVLAALAAGGAFVPLDPAQPADRLAWLLADAQVSAIITDDRLSRDLPEMGARVLRVDADRLDLLPRARRLPALIDPAQPAYVIYTSGSTGRPKGVVVSHRSLVHSTDARRTGYRRQVESFLLVSTLAFDSALAGLFWTLCCGGTLVLPGEDEHGDPAALRRLIERHGVTHALCLPSLYAWILGGALGDAQLDPGQLDAGRRQLSSLQVVIVAGEACPRPLVDRHHRALPGVELHNEYGPTECAVWSTVHEARAEDAGERVPIGRPIARARAFVADRPWELSAWGAPGELLVGGDGVADGYLHRPDLTAERFMPDMWSGRPGARLYRTGDRVQWRQDDALDFLGRLDRQVKVRGYRVELEEIESVIAALAGVRECAVAVHADGQRIEAYVVPGPDSGGDGDGGNGGALIAELRAFVGGRLPGYMTPSDVLLVPALPKTLNGKIDRAALPALRRLRDERPAAAADRPLSAIEMTATEMTIAALWGELLERADVGLHDNFFDLGGHSLLAIEVHHRLQSSTAPSLRLMDLFAHPTVQALAALIDGQQTADAADAAAPAQTTSAADARARRQALGGRRRAARAS